MKLTPLDLSYIAGFFDGEGSVTIHENCKPSPRAKSPNHTLQISIGNTNPVVLAWIHKEFGGSYVLRKKRPSPRHRRMAQWIIRAALALPFVSAIRPYVRMKGAQLDVAIAFQKSKAMRGPFTLTPEILRWRERQRKKIKSLNNRGLTERATAAMRREAKKAKKKVDAAPQVL